MAKAKDGTALQQMNDELSELMGVTLNVGSQLGAANLALDRLVDDLQGDLDPEEIIEIQERLIGLHGILQSCMGQLLAGCEAVDERQTRDATAIQKVLDHKALATTQKYRKVSIKELMDVYDKINPKV
jgi:ATP-dependent exoDNAse (exonuclease V) alpha subunit